MGWLGGILLGALLGYLLEFTRPWVIALFVRGRLTRREKRINYLIKEYKRIQRFRKENFRLIIHILRYVLLSILIGIITLMAVGSMMLSAIYMEHKLALISYWEGHVFFVFISIFVFYVTFYFRGLMMKVYRHEEFKEKTIARLKKLGGNQEDLEKEETEGG